MLAPQTSRLDRHVERSYLHISDHASRHRICCSLEEALRLAVLPGEEEGRVYCFRRITLAGIPARATRREWLDRVQQDMSAIAAQAVHGRDARAASAEAMYFDSLEEGLETLLHNALRSQSIAAWAVPEWFSNSLLGLGRATPYALQIPAIVERLRDPAIAPGAAATILIDSLSGTDPAGLLSALPADTVRTWLRELEGAGRAVFDTPPVDLPPRLRNILQRAAGQFGWRDPGVVWLAAQAVLCVAPGSFAAGFTVKRARATLRILETEPRAERPALSPLSNHPSPQSVLALRFNDDTGDPPQRMLTGGYAASAPEPRSDTESVAPTPGPQECDVPRAPANAQLASDFPPPSSPAANIPTKLSLLGEPTLAAGVFFVLNVLRRLGIATAVETSAALAAAGLAVNILKSFAAEVGVNADDPTLLCLRSAPPEFWLSSQLLADLPQQPKAWPRGFPPSSRSSFESKYFLHVWAVAVRRWCWRAGGLTMRDVILRRGRVWLTRTDLDITFPLEDADIRIRRIGLDIDPGWLPWFGEYGRVVRFHYRNGEPEARSC